MKDPAGIVNLEELDRISSLSGAGDGDVDPQSSPVIATILVTIMSIESTVTASSAVIVLVSSLVCCILFFQYF